MPGRHRRSSADPHAAPPWLLRHRVPPVGSLLEALRVQLATPIILPPSQAAVGASTSRAVSRHAAGTRDRSVSGGRVAALASPGERTSRALAVIPQPRTEQP